MVVNQVRDKEGEEEVNKVDKEVTKEVIKEGIKELDEGSDLLGQMVLVKVKVAKVVVVVTKMVLMEVEGDREAAKVANLVYKEVNDDVR